MKVVIFLFVFLSVIFILSFVGADSVSMNPAGDNVIIGPNPYIQPIGPGGFACMPLTCSGIGANCGTWMDGCGGIIDCGTCGPGYYCDNGICTANVTVPVTPPSGGGIITPPSNVTVVKEIVIVPREINLKMSINTNKKEVIRITNNGNTTKTFSISQTNLTGKILISNDSLTIAPGETKNLEVIFVASEIGIFKGEILIGENKILVNLDIKEKIILFDSNILVLNRGYKVSQGGKLKTKVTLIPMGDKERMDVQLNYVIKDYDGKIYLTHSETVLVEDRMDLYRNFDTGNIPLGKYIIGLELVYPGGKAPSSAHFEIVKTTAEGFLGFVMFTLIVAMLIVSIVIVILSIRIKKRKITTELI